MARTATPRKKKENYFNHGVVGRVTGATLKDRGVRDEHGMEPVEGIFSSVEKSTKTRRESKTTNTSSEAMDVEISSGPTPAQALSQRRTTRDGKSFGPPPMSKSPIKTNIGATPRRQSSAGPVTSPQKSAAPRSTSRTRVNRLLQFGPTHPVNEPTVESIEHTPLSLRAAQSRASVSKPRRSEYSLEPSPDIGMAPEENLLNGSSRADDNFHAAGGDDDGYGPALGDDFDIDAGQDAMEDGVEVEIDDEADDVQQIEAEELADQEEEDASDIQANRESQAPEVSSGRRGRGRISNVSAAYLGDQITSDKIDPELKQNQDADPELDAAPGPAPKKKGRPPKKGSARTTLAQKDGNAKVARTNGTLDKRSGSVDPQVPRALQRMRHVTPAEDDVVRTRSGRLTYKPLSYWKGERVVQSRPLESIQEIIRMDDVTPQKRIAQAQAQAQQAKQRKKRKFTVFEEEEEEDFDSEDGEEPWEEEEGVVSGFVKSWDVDLNAASIEDEDEQELAFASSKIEPREVHNGEFRFAKTLTLPFFGAGIVEIPAKGFKRSKNSRKMQMCFFVHFGKVVVEVAGNRFIISKGGMWQVPRGNLYSITNETSHTAKIFFAQGCEVFKELQQAEALARNVSNLVVANS